MGRFHLYREIVGGLKCYSRTTGKLNLYRRILGRLHLSRTIVERKAEILQEKDGNVRISRPPGGLRGRWILGQTEENPSPRVRGAGRVASHLEVECCSRLRQLTQEMVLEAGPQDILGIRFVGVKRKLLQSNPSVTL